METQIPVRGCNKPLTPGWVCCSSRRGWGQPRTPPGRGQQVPSATHCCTRSAQARGTARSDPVAIGGTGRSSHSDLTHRLWGRGAAPPVGNEHPPIISAASRDPSLQSGEQLGHHFPLRKRSNAGPDVYSFATYAATVRTEKQAGLLWFVWFFFFLVKYLLRKFQS